MFKKLWFSITGLWWGIIWLLNAFGVLETAKGLLHNRGKIVKAINALIQWQWFPLSLFFIGIVVLLCDRFGLFTRIQRAFAGRKSDRDSLYSHLIKESNKHVNRIASEPERPDLVGRIEAVTIGIATGRVSGVAILVVLEILNKGRPTIAERFFADFKSGNKTLTIPSYHPPSDMTIDGKTINPSGMLYEKLKKHPIPSGGREVGKLLFFVKDQLSPEELQQECEVIVHFSDVFSREYKAKSALNWIDGADTPAHIPGLEDDAQNAPFTASLEIPTKPIEDVIRPKLALIDQGMVGTPNRATRFFFTVKNVGPILVTKTDFAFVIQTERLAKPPVVKHEPHSQPIDEGSTRQISYIFPSVDPEPAYIAFYISYVGKGQDVKWDNDPVFFRWPGAKDGIPTFELEYLRDEDVNRFKEYLRRHELPKPLL